MGDWVRIELDTTKPDMDGKINKYVASSARKILTNIDKTAMKYLKSSARSIQLIAKGYAPVATGTLRDSISISYDLDRSISGAKGRRFRENELIGSVRLTMDAGHAYYQEFGHKGGYRHLIQKSAGTWQTIGDWLSQQKGHPRQHPLRKTPSPVILTKKLSDQGGSTKFLRGNILGRAFNDFFPTMKGGLRSVLRAQRGTGAGKTVR